MMIKTMHILLLLAASSNAAIQNEIVETTTNNEVCVEGRGVFFFRGQRRNEAKMEVKACTRNGDKSGIASGSYIAHALIYGENSLPRIDEVKCMHVDEASGAVYLGMEAKQRAAPAQKKTKMMEHSAVALVKIQSHARNVKGTWRTRRRVKRGCLLPHLGMFVPT